MNLRQKVELLYAIQFGAGLSAIAMALLTIFNVIIGHGLAGDQVIITLAFSLAWVASTMKYRSRLKQLRRHEASLDPVE